MSLLRRPQEIRRRPPNGAEESHELSAAIEANQRAVHTLRERMSAPPGDLTPIETPSGQLLEAMRDVLEAHGDHCFRCQKLRALLG